MRKRKYESLDDTTNKSSNTIDQYKRDTIDATTANCTNLDESKKSSFSIPNPIPQCHNIVSTSQILTSQENINLQISQGMNVK